MILKYRKFTLKWENRDWEKESDLLDRVCNFVNSIDKSNLQCISTFGEIYQNNIGPYEWSVYPKPLIVVWYWDENDD